MTKFYTGILLSGDIFRNYLSCDKHLAGFC